MHAVVSSNRDPGHLADLAGVQGGVVAEGALGAGPLPLLRGCPRQVQGVEGVMVSRGWVGVG